MINTKKFSSHSEKKLYFLKNFDHYNHAILVADLESKKNVQRLIFKNHDILVNAKVFRALDFWSTLFIKIKPDWQILTMPHLIVTIESLLIQKKIHGLSVSECINGIKQVLPLLLHPENIEALEDYKSRTQIGENSWIVKFNLIKIIWETLSEQKMTTSSWLSAQLLYETLPTAELPQKIFVDITYELENIEKEIINNISKYIDVELWELAKAEVSLDARVYSHPQEECKAAVAEIRGWAEQKIPLNQIQVLVADLETYWPFLRIVLAREGLFYNKNLVYPLSDNLFFKKWISKIKLISSFGQAKDLNLEIFATDEKPELEKEKFEKLYTNNINIEHQDFLNLVNPRTLDLESFESSEDFLKIAFDLVPSELPRDLCEKLYLNWCNNVPKSQLFNRKQWILLLELMAEKIEIKIEDDFFSEEGVKLTNLLGGEWSECTHRIYIGLDEKSLSVERNPVFPIEELMRISSLYGFPIETEKKYTFESYLNNVEINNVYFSYSKLDFEGNELVPPRIMLKLNAELVNAKPTVYQTHISNPPIFLPSYQVKKNISLSASTIEKYLECPAKIFYSKVLNLEQIVSVDIEPDPMQKGSLYHKICEKLIQQNLDFRSTSKTAFIKDCILEDDRPWDTNFFDQFVQRYVDFADRFINYEQKNRLDFPNRYNLNTELSFLVYYDYKAKSFLDHSTENCFKIRGKIDRIDVDKLGNGIIIDYKSSTSAIQSSKSWLENGQWQLLLYAYLIDKKIISLDSVKNISSCIYLSLKDFDSSKGFFIKDQCENLIASPSGRSQSLWSVDEKNEMYTIFEEKFFDLVTNLIKGDFSPKPKEIELCEKCEWSIGCRASHLM